jgi:hypothetical protein
MIGRRILNGQEELAHRGARIAQIEYPLGLFLTLARRNGLLIRSSLHGLRRAARFRGPRSILGDNSRK